MTRMRALSDESAYLNQERSRWTTGGNCFTSGGVDGHAANSGSTRGSDTSHKAVMYGTAATGDNAYQAPLAGIKSGPLTLLLRSWWPW